MALSYEMGDLTAGMSLNMRAGVLHPATDLRNLLLALIPLVLCAEPGSAQERAETPERFATQLAEQHYHDFGSPTIVRRNDQLTDCATMNEDGGRVQVAFQEVLTEFVYSPRWVCVSTFTPALPAEASKRIVRFKSDNASRVFGSVGGGNYLERQRLGFQFPANPAEAPGGTDLGDFAARLPKILNIGRAGALGAAVSNYEAGAGVQPAAETPPGRPIGNPPAQEAQTPGNSPWLLKAALLAGFLVLAAVTAFLVHARLELRKVSQTKVEPVKAKAALQLPVAAHPRSARRDVLATNKVDVRTTLSFAVNNVQDERRAREIDGLLQDLPKYGVGPQELNEMITIARSVHAWAVKDKLGCPLELVKLYLADKLEAIKRNPDAV